MTIFTIDEQNNITAFAGQEEAAAANPTPFDSFGSQKELAGLMAGWPAERLVAVWNSLPGVTPIKNCKGPQAAAARVWKRIQNLGEPQKPQSERKANGGARSAKGTSAKGKPARKNTAAKHAPKGKKTAPAPPPAPRKGSKATQVIAMLRRKNGATLSEIVEKMGWQKHTVRGFMAGTLKKAGYPVESFKPEGGERTYRLNK
jgi:hypothetical protein